MEHPTDKMLCIGEWRLDPASGQISRDGQSQRLEARTLRLLLCLAERAGTVVSIDDLLAQAWSEVNVSQDSVYQAVTSLRRLLGDDPKQPTYIETVPRLGYRMIATVAPWSQQSAALPDASLVSASQHSASAVSSKAPGSRFGLALRLFLGTAVLLAIALFLFRGKLTNSNHSGAAPAQAASQPQLSIAVLPFLDLTEGMKEEEFADGMTEELIDKLSKIPDFRVPSPTSSFYFKGKQIPVSDIAQKLGVAYVLDGSVRKSGSRVRIAARLIRPQDGFVIWTETYDRPFDDVILIQDDIAGEVTKALKASIKADS
jgi:TolB-like protein/DNA-binding winged helix-turn-helix (wHTH) protein